MAPIQIRSSSTPMDWYALSSVIAWAIIPPTAPCGCGCRTGRRLSAGAERGHRIRSRHTTTLARPLATVLVLASYRRGAAPVFSLDTGAVVGQPARQGGAPPLHRDLPGGTVGAVVASHSLGLAPGPQVMDHSYGVRHRQVVLRAPSHAGDLDGIAGLVEDEDRDVPAQPPHVGGGEEGAAARRTASGRRRY